MDAYEWIRNTSKYNRRFKKAKARKDHRNHPRVFLPYISQSLLSKATSARLHKMLKSYSMMRKETRTNHEIFNILLRH